MSVHLSRRVLIKGGALVAAGSFLPQFARRALADEDLGPGRRKALVFLFLRGALDGLHVLSPCGEPRFAQLRPQLALPAPDAQGRDQRLLDLGVPGFGLHPALAPLLPFWQEGSLALVHAVGSPDPTRSHFDAQDFLELGTPGVKGTPDGWLARSLREAAMPGEKRSPLDAVAVSARLPRALQGAPDALAFASLDQLRLRPMAGGPGGQKGRTEARTAFEALYGQGGDEPVATSGKEAFAALDLLERKLGQNVSPPSVPYPGGPIGQSLRQLAQLIKADLGLRVGCADAGGWDTHAAQPAQLASNLKQLAEALSAFRRDLGPRAEEVVLVAATEFGRTVRQNGANGTDHGHASVAFVLGGGVRGGRMHGRWPGLADGQLYQGRDLAVTTDLRSVLAAAAAAQLGARDVQRLFPGFSGQPLAGLFT
jgi:uncharacterized protein (DUF1501 family)